MRALDLFRADFCVTFKCGNLLVTTTGSYPIATASFVEETSLFPWIISHSFVKEQLACTRVGSLWEKTSINHPLKSLNFYFLIIFYF